MKIDISVNKTKAKSWESVYSSAVRVEKERKKELGQGHGEKGVKADTCSDL